MPFVNSKITFTIDEDAKERVQGKLTNLIAEVLGKPKKFIMVNIEDNQQIWFAGKKMEKGAFISVRLMGDATKSAYNELTKKICDFLEQELKIEAENVYVTFHPVENWGWNGEIL